MISPVVGRSIEPIVTNQERMTAADPELIEETEADRVARWRAEELERAGYSAGAASDIAFRADIDLHVAVELVERGCSEELALKILL